MDALLFITFVFLATDGDGNVCFPLLSSDSVDLFLLGGLTRILFIISSLLWISSIKFCNPEPDLVTDVLFSASALPSVVTTGSLFGTLLLDWFLSG